MFEAIVTIKDRRLIFDQILNLKDGEYKLTIKKSKNQRSIKQLSYLWATVYPPIADHTGYTTEDIHTAMKTMFLRDRITVKTLKGDIEIPHLRSLSSSGDVNTAEMSDYIERIRAWASAYLGIIIPDPNGGIE